MFKDMHVITKIALILGFGCLVADIVAIQVGTAKPLTPDMALVLDLGYCATWIYVAVLERKLVKAGIALWASPENCGGGHHPLEDPMPKSPEGDTTDLVIRQTKIIHELRTELEALKKFTACTRSHPHEAMAQDCELRTEIARLTNELARLRAAPAVPQGEPVAWMVYGNYTRQPFGMLCSAEAYMRGLLKSDPDGGYHIRPLRYATPAPAQEVGLTDEALDNLIEDLSEWSRHVVEDTAHQTLEAHVREVLAKNPIIAALRAKGGK